MLGERKVKVALRWPDDRVSVFDENGREIAELLGPYEMMREKILALSYAKTSFRRAVVKTTLLQVTREEW